MMLITRDSADGPTALDTGERGAVLPIVALLIVVLLVFAAFTVDFGAAWAIRRGEQTAADTAVLAGAVEFQTSGGDPQSAVDQLVLFATTNAHRSITPTQWSACVDSERLDYTASEFVSAGMLTGPDTDCISFSAGGDEIRVRLPDNPVPTSFGRLAGVDVMNVSAAANATIRIPTTSSSPPFVVLFGVNGGDEVCLRTSSSGSGMPGQWVGNGRGVGDLDYDNYDITEIPLDADPTQPLFSDANFSPDPCDETAFPAPSNFFGTLNPYFYKDANPSSAPDTSCTNTGVNSVDVGIAEGIDHNLSSFEPDHPSPTSPAQTRVDGDGCPSGPPQLWPNTMASQSGFSAQILKCGLVGSNTAGCGAGPVLDSTTFTPRLQRGPDDAAGATFAGRTFENLPLWYFFRPSIASVNVPDSCDDLQAHANDTVSVPDSSSWDYFDKKEALLDCLTTWNPANQDPIFDDRILQSGRFAFIPQLAETALANPVHFNSFVPVWFQALYQSGNKQGSPDLMCFSQAEGATGNSGWYRHEAGQGFDCGRSVQNVDRLSAIVLDCGMFSGDTCIPDHSPPNPGGDPVFQILLSK